MIQRESKETGAETQLVRERVGRTWGLAGRGDWEAVGSEREGGNEANAWIPALGVGSNGKIV